MNLEPNNLALAGAVSTVLLIMATVYLMIGIKSKKFFNIVIMIFVSLLISVAIGLLTVIIFGANPDKAGRLSYSLFGLTAQIISLGMIKLKFYLK